MAARRRRRPLPSHRAALQPVPRPARPLRRAGGAGRRLERAGRRARGRHRVRAERRRSAGRRPRARRRGRHAAGHHVLRARGPRARAGAHRARLGREALPPLRHRVPVLGRVPRPPRRLPLPQLRQRAARSRRCRAATWSCSACRARASRCAPRAARRASRCACPASTTSTTRWAPRRPAACSSASSLDEIRRGLESFAAAFGRAEQIAIGGRQVAILLVKNPAGANEVFRTLAAAGRVRPRRVDGPERRHRRRARRLLDLGRGLRDPRPACVARRVLRHARRGAGAAPQVRGRRAGPARGGAGARARPRPRARRTATGARSTPSPPTPRCSSCATC